MCLKADFWKVERRRGAMRRSRLNGRGAHLGWQISHRPILCRPDNDPQTIGAMDKVALSVNLSIKFTPGRRPWYMQTQTKPRGDRFSCAGKLQRCNSTFMRGRCEYIHLPPFFYHLIAPPLRGLVYSVKPQYILISVDLQL